MSKSKKKNRNREAAPASPQSTTRRTVTLDGVQIVVDFSVMRNVRLLRRTRNDDIDAFFEMLDKLFPEGQLDSLEDRFGLEDVDEYSGFVQRVMGALNPNS